jgi:hypothetical protein
MCPILTCFYAVNLHIADMEFFGKRFQGVNIPEII